MQNSSSKVENLRKSWQGHNSKHFKEIGQAVEKVVQPHSGVLIFNCIIKNAFGLNSNFKESSISKTQ